MEKQVDKSNVRVSILRDGEEQVFLLLGGARDGAVPHYLGQALHCDGRGAVGGVQALVHGGELVPLPAEVAARLPGFLRLQNGADRVYAGVGATVVQQVVFPTVVACHGGGGGGSFSERQLCNLPPPDHPEALPS